MMVPTYRDQQGDLDALAVLKRQIADCDARLVSLTNERGRLVEAYMELDLRRHYQTRLHAPYENRDRDWPRKGNPKKRRDYDPVSPHGSRSYAEHLQIRNQAADRWKHERER